MNKSQPSNTPTYPIRYVAKIFDLSCHTLRKYERAGLLLPFKKESKHRLYSDEDIERVEFIINAIHTEGLNLEGIRQLISLLPCWNLKNCGIDNREECPAFQEYKNPCWMIEETLCSQKERDCRNCSVYRQSLKNIRRLKKFMVY